jgi:hypothetical protein
MTSGSSTLPAGLRLRAVQPLVDRDHSCPLVYDLERTLLVDVPVEYRLHLPHLMDLGSLDDEVAGWLAGRDLLTYEDTAEPPGGDGAWRAAWEALDGGQLGSVWVGEDEVHCHPLAGSEEGCLAALDALLAVTNEGRRVVLHLPPETGCGRPAELAGILLGARRLGRASGRSVALELTADGRCITPAVARALADHEVAVRLTAESRPAIDLLLRHLPERFTLCVILDTGERLADLWGRAVAYGLRRLHATKVTDRPAASPLALPAAEQRQYRRDLFHIADALFAGLAEGRRPQPLYEPLARIVLRHLSGRPAAVGARGSGGYHGMVGRAGFFPMLGTLAGGGGEAAGEGGCGDGDRPAACADCWARRLCARGLEAVGGRAAHLPRPRDERCEFWRAEVEVGLLLYDQVEKSDPEAFLSLTDGGLDLPFFDPFGSPPATGLAAC